MIYAIYRMLTGIYLRLFHRLLVLGAENIAEGEGVMVVSNHASLFDPIVIGVGAQRRIVFIARGSLTEHWLFRLLVRPLRIIMIRRNESDREALRAIAGELERGSVCCIFPEGTRSVDGELAELKSGFALVAQRTGVPVVPAYVGGSFQVWPKSRKLPRLTGRLSVRFGEPLRFDRSERRDDCVQKVRSALLLLEREASQETNHGAGVGPENTSSETQGCDPTARSMSVVEVASNS